MAGHKLSPTILREYDIRGTVGEDLTAADATAIGRAFATWLAAKGGKTVHVGRDGRSHSPDAGGRRWSTGSRQAAWT